VQPLGLPQDGAGVLQQSPARLRRRYSSPAAGQERDPKRLLHVPDPRGGGRQRKIRALRTMRNAAGFNHVPKQTEVSYIESHDATFAKYETRLIIMAIAYRSIND